MAEPIVYIVHAVDVEGPMTETLSATFERMQSYGLPDNVDRSKENLSLIQNGKFPGLSIELSDKLKRVFHPRYLAYLTDWEQIDRVLTEVTNLNFRNKFCSKDGSSYILSWFIYDHHEGFKNNPRFHDIGTHKIFDHFTDGILKNNTFDDGIYWHYHHPSITGDALESNTCWSNRTTHEEIIARRIIECRWYFSVFRAGMHIERNDVSHWLEMYFPFDFSARYSSDISHYPPGSDFDWRGLPKTWRPWHPDWYDYRKQGSMKRWLFRCTDLSTYLHSLIEDEVEEAFEEASVSGMSVLTYYNHDYRDMRAEIEEGYETIKRVSQKYSRVNWKFVNALDAAQKVLGIKPRKPVISYRLNRELLMVQCEGSIFGPQPFLAINESGVFYRDNFTKEGKNKWAYRFRKLPDVRSFGVAANSPSGLYDIKVHHFVE